MSSSAATTPLKLRRRLLHGASAVVFLATLGGGGAHAQSAAGLRAAAGIGTAAAMARPKPTPTGPNIQGMNSASARALINQTRSQAAMDLAAQAQKAARDAARALNPNVPNGLVFGGLDPVDNPVAAADDPSGLNTWDGAEAPTQTTDANGVTVTVKQTGSKAILSWETFNVGAGTTLVFDQKLNGQAQTDWVALNRVVGQLDPATGLRNPNLAPAPSQILGSIKADGTVLVLNQNGVIFGGTSQVNAHSLIASTLEIGRAFDLATGPLTIKQRNTEFLNFGLLGYADQASANDKVSAYTFSAQGIAGGAYDPTPEGEIKVEAGAEITAGNGGFILMTGPKVINAGHLSATEGQVSLQSGRQITVQRSEGSAASLDPNVRGFIVSSENRTDAAGNYVVNTREGLIESKRGYLSLGATTGGAVIQEGVLSATTSVARNGFIDITGGDIKIAADSVLSVTPDEGNETIPQSGISVSAFKPSKVNIGDATSRIEIGANSLIYAPSGDISIGAAAGPATTPDSLNPGASRVFIDTGAVIDASGLKDVLIPATRNSILIRPVKKNELRDTPNYKDGFLNGSFVYVDPRLSGVRADGVAWVGSPLIEAESYYQQVGVKVSELMTTGGNVSIGVASAAGATGLFTAPDVIIKSGASIDISGGWTKYEGGFVQTTKLVNAQGQVVDIAYADPNDTYIGVYNGYTLYQPRWGQAETFANPILTGSYYAGEYTEGRDAGTLTIKSSVTALDGNVYADSFPGALQLQRGGRGTGSSGVFGDLRRIQGAASQLPSGGFLFIQALGKDANGAITGGGDIQIVGEDSYTGVPDDLAYGQGVSIDANGNLVSVPRDPLAVLPPERMNTIQLSADALSNMGLGQLTLATSGAVTVAADADVEMDPGATFDVLAGRTITIDGVVQTASGTINLETANVGFGSIFNPTGAQLGSFDIVVNGMLSTRGQWINDYRAAPDQIRSRQYIDGGQISLTTAPRVSLLSETATVGDTLSGEAPTVNTDISGSILLNEGSLIDVSAGGYVYADGSFDLSGRGGDLSLINDTTYFQLTDDANRPAGAIPGFRVNTILDGGGNAVIPVNPDKINAKVALNGTILAHGFNGGGTFTLHTPSFQFGDQPIEGGTALSLDFFSKTGFANYDIVSYKTALLDNDFDNGLGGYNAVLAYQTVTIGQGETLSLSQSMFSPLLGVDQRAALLGLGSGGDLYSVLDPSIAPEAWDRRAVNLNLGGTIELHIAEGGTLTNDAGGTLAVSKLFNEGTIRMPGGTIRQSAILPGIYTSASAIGVHDLSGAFTIGPDGSIAEGDPNAAGVFGLTNGQLAGQSPIYLLGELDADEGVRLGSGSTTDLSGVSIVNPRAEALGQNVYTPIRDGVVIGGGSLISVAAAQLDGKLFNAGFGTGVYTAQNPVAVRAALQVNAEAGAKLDLSGASDTFVRLDRLQTTPIGASPGYTETAVWSNGGLLMLGNGGSITQANLDAHGGADAASGGTLVILDPTLTQHDTDDATPNSLSADFIGRSGFDTLQALGSLSSVGDVSLRLDRGFFLSSRPYGGLAGQNLNDPALRDAFAPVISSGGRLEIWAPYIRFDSQLQSVTTPFLGALADNSAIFHAGTIDISGAVVFDQSIGTAVLDATNAVRLSGVQPYQLIYGVGDQTVANSLAGQLAVNGDLTIRAGQVYPTTGSSFAITSSALDGTITFERNGPTPATPYSAGGSLLVQAANIVQGGVIQVPLGRLTLGSNTAFERTTGGTTATFAPVTQSVRLTDGSVTSVSAEGLTIPYGVTTDGIEWFFSPTGANRLTAPPEAVLSLGGVDVAMESGATVNVKGGGDLVAYEFVPGTGGSRDVLSQFNNDPFSGNDGYQYPDQRQVYAVVPGLSDQAVAAYDPIYSQDYGNLYGVSSAGKRVYLENVPGLAAGWYTLLPAQYALLPGGFRVVEQSGVGDPSPGFSGKLADGSYYVAGYYGDAASGARSSDLKVFQVMSQDVIRKYSTIQLTYANKTFADLAAKAGQVAPRLPIDAGRLILNPSQTLTIDANILTAPGQGGRGAQADISGLSFEILSAPGTGSGAEGVIALTAGSLSNLNAASLLIGGVRTNNADGTTTLDVTANSITVANDSSNPLTGPEIVLAVDGDGSSITLADGSAIVASGTLDDDRSGDYILDGSRGSMTGEGAVVRVASGQERLVRRVNTDATPGESALIVGDANVTGDNVLLNSSGDLSVSAGAGIVAKNLAVGAGQVTFTDNGDGLSGLIITSSLQELFGRAQRLTIQTPQAIGFDAGEYLFGDLRLDAPGLLGRNGDVVLKTGDLTLSNSSAATADCDAAGALACGTGQLTVQASEIIFGSGAVKTYGFGDRVSLAASQGMFVEGRGSFNAGPAALVLDTPFLGDRATTASPLGALSPSLEIATTGALTIVNNSGADIDDVDGAPGASLTLSGDTVSIDGARVRSTAGLLKVTAQNGLTVGNGAILETPGYAKDFGDEADSYSVSAPGGYLQLTSVGGSITLADGSLLSVGGGAGRAGTLKLSAGNGQVFFGGQLSADAPDGGGSFILDTGGAFDLATFDTGFASDFTGTIAVRSGDGDLVLASGQTLTAENVYLVADGGSVDIAGKIDTSGVSGGDVSLFGADGVTLESTAVIDAHANGYAALDSRQAHGGTVSIGVDGDGAIRVENGALIDVSARRTDNRLVPMVRNGTTYYTYVSGDLGGVVNFRAPVIERPGADTVNVFFAGSISGARSIVLEGFKRFDLGEIAANPDFVGVTINADGQAVLDIGAVADAGQANWLSGDAAGGLVEFVQDFDISGADGQLGSLTSSDVFHARPGMELAYGGDIVLNSNWNLGAGSVDVQGAVAAGLMAELPSVPGKYYILPGKEAEVYARFTSMVYRTDGEVTGEPGVLTLRAGGDLDIKGSISDGFFQFRDQTDPDYLNIALGGGNQIYNPYLSVACFGGTCATVGEWAATGGVLPPGYVTINVPGATGLSGVLSNPAPYSQDANSASAPGSLAGGGGDPLGSAELFPLLKTSGGDWRPVESWSYRLVGGADLSSADPMQTLAGGPGDVIVEGRRSYTFQGVKGTSTFADDLLFRVAGQFVDAAAVYESLVQANPDLAATSFTFVNFATAPLGAKTVLQQMAADYFADHPGGFEYTGPAGAPTGVTTSLDLADGFMRMVADNFDQLAPFYKAPVPAVTTRPVTGATATLIRTGTGDIDIAAARNIDLRNGEPIYRKVDGTLTTAGLGSQVGGAAVYTAGHRVDMSARNAIDAVTGAVLTIDPGAFAISADVFNTPSASGYRYGAGGDPTAPGAGLLDTMIANPVYAEGGGDVSLNAGQDVLSRRDLWRQSVLLRFQNGGGLTPYGWVGGYDQFWRSGTVGAVTNIRVNSQLFNEGVGALGGGDIRIVAGRDISDLSVVSDTSISTGSVGATGDLLALAVFGGGDVNMIAGRDLLGGRIDVARGSATVEAGGSVAPTGTIQAFDGNAFQTISNSLRLRLSDATIAVTAGGAIEVQGIASLGARHAAASTQDDLMARGLYGTYAGVSLTANGDVTVANLGADVVTGAGPANDYTHTAVYPGSLEAQSILGDVNLITAPAANNAATNILLYPSPVGTLTLAAGGDIAGTVIGMDDGDAGLLPGAFSIFTANAADGVLSGRTFLFPGILPDTSDIDRAALHNANLTHEGDEVPNRIYAGGDINNLILSVPKQTRIGAGRDIVNMVFVGQNLSDKDITRIVAGRDITATTSLVRPFVGLPNEFGVPLSALQGNTFVIGGPGAFFLEAGRDLGPFLNSAVVSGFDDGIPSPTAAPARTYGGGVLSVGNEWNPALGDDGADLYVQFGVAKGANYDGFRDYYLDPANLQALDGDLFEQVKDDAGQLIPDRSKPIYQPTLIKWMQTNAAASLTAAYGTTAVTYEQAYAAFKALPPLEQRVFMLKNVYFNELTQTSVPTGPSFQQYSRGYRAVNTLFPAELGYTNNRLEGENGAEHLIHTGDLDLRLATLQTSRGGDIFILGPGGRVLAGSTVRTSDQAARRAYDGGRLFAGSSRLAPLPAVINSIPTGFEGVLTLRGGGIYAFTDGDFLLNQSRLFTQAGGDIAMWSSNGDLNAGQGPKNAANFPPVVVKVSANLSSEVDTAGAVSGAGIAAFQPDPNATPPNVFLIAPAGTVDAGDAGVRVSGSLFVAAQTVANADNFSVGGSSFGVVGSAPVDAGSQAAASSASAAAQEAAQSAASGGQRGETLSVITVNVLGAADGECDDNDPDPKKHCRAPTN